MSEVYKYVELLLLHFRYWVTLKSVWVWGNSFIKTHGSESRAASMHPLKPHGHYSDQNSQ